ncbi:MarR family winged helix-turn-helix transcriptional regulator [Hyphomonas johnsonii]|jgi:DNA-binding MarR family transcriptional regulator|uniref:MarR family transcriptional regulator n=1 Tax=Hyphomonas johnsonii MHS-2 TaxID=1280950 RepID=A0A059FQZ1_9PROT|nr:MarR family transcriptional regulator [Hyphomonas johnsonii]KCZ92893.1 MarR family transcriptional regulator [Hyphomonas johnsonii MHS-2]
MPDPADKTVLRLREFLPYRLSVLSNTVSRGIADLYDRAFGLSIWQWRVMAVLGENAAITATEIGQFTAMDKVAVSRAVASLLDSGHIAREASLEDGRRALLSLTAKGKDVYEQIVPIALGAERNLVSALSAEEHAQLDGLMEKLARAAAPDRDLW